MQANAHACDAVNPCRNFPASQMLTTLSGRPFHSCADESVWMNVLKGWDESRSPFAAASLRCRSAPVYYTPVCYYSRLQSEPRGPRGSAVWVVADAMLIKLMQVRSSLLTPGLLLPCIFKFTSVAAVLAKAAFVCISYIRSTFLQAAHIGCLPLCSYFSVCFCEPNSRCNGDGINYTWALHVL